MSRGVRYISIRPLGLRNFRLINLHPAKALSESILFQESKLVRAALQKACEFSIRNAEGDQGIQSAFMDGR